MKKALITGIAGFAGSFLAEHIATLNNYRISGTYIDNSGLENLAKIRDKTDIVQVDLQNPELTEDLIRTVKPDLVFHLAALSSAAESFKNPAQYISNNLGAQVNIFEGIKKANLFPRVLVVSSAEVYGEVKASDLPINEETRLAPVNPYAVSKVAQDFLGLQYFLSYKMPVIRVRPFNHIGPRQSPKFAVASFAKKIAEIEKGKTKPILRVGNLDAKRDFTDVRDIVRGYIALIEKGVVGDVYNIGSGKSYKMSFILDTLLSLSNKEIKVEVDKTLLRPVDVRDLVCDISKITRETGWKPKIPLEKSLSDTLDYWRGII